MVRYVSDTNPYADLPCNSISQKGKAYKKEYKQMTTYGQVSQKKLLKFTDQFLKQNFKQAQKVYSLLYQGTQANIYQEKWSKFQNQASDYQTKLDSLSSYIDKNLESLDRLKEQIIKDFQKQMQLLVEKMSETIFSLISEYNELVDSHFKNMTNDINNTLQMINIQSRKLDDELEKLNSNQERKLAIEQISLTVNLDRQKIQAYAAIFKMTSSQEELIQNLADQSAKQQQNLQPLKKINCDQITCKQIYYIMKLFGKIQIEQTQSSQIKKTSSEINKRFSFEDQIDQKSVFKQIQEKIVASEQLFKQKTQNLLVQKKRGPQESDNSQTESLQIENLGLKEFLKMINQLSQILNSQVNKSLMSSVQKNIEESFILTNQFTNLESYNEYFQGWDKSYRRQIRNESKKVYQVIQVKQDKKKHKLMQCENDSQKIKNKNSDNHQKYNFSQQQSYYSQKLSNRNRGKGSIENSTANIDTVKLDDSQEINQQKDQNSVLHHQSENEQSALQPQIIQPIHQQYQDHYVQRMKLKTFIEEQVSRAERQYPEDIQTKFKQQKQRYNIKPQNYQMKSDYQKKPKEYQTWKAEDIFKKTPQQQQIVKNWSQIKQRCIEDSSDIIYRSKQDEQAFEESDYQVYGSLQQKMNLYGQKRTQNYLLQGNDRQFQEQEIFSLMKQYDVDQQRKIYEEIQRNKNRLFEQSPYQKSIVRRSQNVYARQFEARQNEQKRKQQQRNNQILKYALNMSIEQQQLPNKHILATSNNRIFQPIQPISRNFFNERLKPREQQRVEQRRFENDLQNSFDYLQELFSRIMKREQTFSIQSGYDLDFMEEDEKQYERNFRLRSPQNRITNSTRLTIKQISQNRDQLIADEQYFVILVKVIKPVLLTFKIKQNRPNLPMTKLIVGDQTGIAVLYMNYYCDVKAGCCLRLQKARLYSYIGSYELNHHSRLTLSNIKEGNAVPYVKMESYLSHIHPNLSGELTYPKKCYYNQTLEDIMRTFVNHRKIIAEESRKDPIILTVCEVLPNKKYILGDYTGKIMADFMNYRQSWFEIGQTLVIRGAKFINTGSKFYISTQKSTRIIQTHLRWKFTHDMRFIPKKMF